MATNKDFIVKNGLQVGGNITVTGRITQSGLEFPASDGTDGQFLKTDGAGSLSFATIPETGFQTIAVDGQTSITSDQVNDTLTFAAGAGIAITTDEPTDVVTIAVDANTDEITEGSTNLFHSDQRAVDAVEAHPHLTIDGGTLYVDTDNNYVGIGDTSPQHVLDVAGAIGVNGTEVVNSSGEVVSSVADSALTVGGSLSGPLSNTKVQYGTTYSGTPAQGSFFFDSLNQKLMVYTGSSFVDAVPAGSGGGGEGEITDANTTFRKYSYTITSTTNAISGADDSSETLSYVTDGTENVEVYVNGIKQVEGSNRDYVATTGNSVTFTYNVPAGSTVDIQVYEFLSNDAYYVKNEVYTKTETNTQISTGLSSYLPLAGGTLTGNLSTGTATLNTNGVINYGNGTTSVGALSYGSGLITLEASSSNTSLRLQANGTGDVQFAAGGTIHAALTDSGNFGIGTTSPSSKLHIADGNNSAWIGDLNGNSTMSLRMHDNSANPVEVQAYSKELRLRTTPDGGSITDRITVLSDGNVGIGTTSPASPLTVFADGIGIRLDGSANATRKIFFRSTSTTNPAEIYADGTLKLWTEDPNTNLSLEPANKVVIKKAEDDTGHYTFLDLHRVDSGDLEGIGGDGSFIDFTFNDANANSTPQLSIGAEVGNRDEGDSGLTSEGRGAFVVKTNSGADSLTEKFRVSWDGYIQATGAVTNVTYFKSTTATNITDTSNAVIGASNVTVTARGNNSNFVYHIVLSHESDISSANNNGFFWLEYNINSAGWNSTNVVINQGDVSDASGGSGNNAYTLGFDPGSVAKGSTLDFRLRYKKSVAGGMQFNQQSLAGQPSGSNHCSGYVMEIGS